MILEGKVYKSDESIFWLAEIPLLDFMTQAETKEEIPAFVTDALETLINDASFPINAHISNDQLFVESNDQKKLVSLLLKRQRE